MDLFWCGFNGFNQLNNESNTNLDFHLYDNKGNEEVQQVTFSWSTASVLTSSGQIVISGLVNKRIVNCEVLDGLQYGPFKSISISESNVLAVNTSGKCLSYLKTNGKWNNISQVLQSENKISISENHKLLPIIDVYCSDTIHLAVTDNEIYSIPTKIFDSKFKVNQVACGFEHIVILMETGCLYTQGSSRSHFMYCINFCGDGPYNVNRGQLGHGELNEEDCPRLLKSLDGIRVINISAGGWHSAAITNCNDLYMWGWNHSGQLGISNCPENGGVIMAPEPILINWPEETDIEQVLFKLVPTAFIFK